MKNEHANLVDHPSRRLRRAAWIAFITHLLAGLAMLSVLSNGLETNPEFSSRIRYIADHVAWWRVAWFSWSIAAAAILNFFACFVWAHEVPRQEWGGACRFALLLATVGVAADLAAEAIEMGVLPGMAQRLSAEGTGAMGNHATAGEFQAFHRVTVMLSGYLANGLYSTTALILVWTTKERYAQWVWCSGVCVGVSGLALSVACLADSVSGMYWSNVVLVPLILVWLAGVGLSKWTHPT